MTIQQIEQTSSGVYKLTPDSGSAFFLRTRYLVQAESLDLLSRMTGCLACEPCTVSDCIAEDLLYASLCYTCEMRAMLYLARAEQCRAGLTKKLIAKGIDKAVITVSLDYLEEAGYLDDFRFAGAWLRSRSIDHAEGRTRLEAELASRGVRRECAKKALDEFFDGMDEEAICRRALDKLIRKKTPEQKLYAGLVRLGFSSSVIKSVLKQNEF